MSRSDWIGLGASILLHGGLAILFAFLTASKPPPAQLGYVEVEFGEFSPGQPVEATEETKKTTTPKSKTEAPEPETKPEKTEKEPESEPVNLPKEKKSDETVPPTEEETTVPEAEAQPKSEKQSDKQAPSEEPGDESGDPGTGTQEDASAPYNIEGLDRDPERAPMPQYTKKVNARIRIRITVNPEGRIIRRIPLKKGSPKLEAAVMDALQQWQFNALPPGAPQEDQTGTITFTFRLE
ncbi:MAG: TonB family protein [Salinibacter sp.]